MVKQSSIVTIFVLVASISLAIFVPDHRNFITWVDYLFLCSLMSTTTGMILTIIQSDVFGPFIRNFTYFFRKLSKESQVADAVERKNPRGPRRHIKFPIRIPLLIGGLIPLICSIILSLLV